MVGCAERSILPYNNGPSRRDLISAFGLGETRKLSRLGPNRPLGFRLKNSIMAASGEDRRVLNMGAEKIDECEKLSTEGFCFW
jgi:hypothetical protein